jgi:hypothetical protein
MESMIVRRLLGFLVLLTLAAWNLAPLSLLRECFAMHSRAVALHHIQPPAEQCSARALIHGLDCCTAAHRENRHARANSPRSKACTTQSVQGCTSRVPQGMLLTSSVKTVVPPREAALRPLFANPTRA